MGVYIDKRWMDRSVGRADRCAPCALPQLSPLSHQTPPPTHQTTPINNSQREELKKIESQVASLEEGYLREFAAGNLLKGWAVALQQLEGGGKEKDKDKDKAAGRKIDREVRLFLCVCAVGGGEWDLMCMYMCVVDRC